MMKGFSFAMKYLSAAGRIETNSRYADQTRNRNRRRKNMSGAPAWATSCGNLLSVVIYYWKWIAVDAENRA